MVLRRRLSVACAFMLSRIGATSWPLFPDWLLIYRTPDRPPAHSAPHKGTEGLSEVKWSSVGAMCEFLHCSPCFKSEILKARGQTYSPKKSPAEPFDCFVHLMCVSCPFMSISSLFHLKKLPRMTVFFGSWLSLNGISISSQAFSSHAPANHGNKSGLDLRRDCNWMLYIDVGRNIQFFTSRIDRKDEQEARENSLILLYF